MASSGHGQKLRADNVHSRKELSVIEWASESCPLTASPAHCLHEEAMTALTLVQLWGRHGDVCFSLSPSLPLLFAYIFCCVPVVMDSRNNAIYSTGGWKGRAQSFLPPTQNQFSPAYHDRTLLANRPKTPSPRGSLGMIDWMTGLQRTTRYLVSFDLASTGSIVLCCCNRANLSTVIKAVSTAQVYMRIVCILRLSSEELLNDSGRHPPSFIDIIWLGCCHP